MRAPEEHDRIIIDEAHTWADCNPRPFDEALATTLEKYKPQLARHIFNPPADGLLEVIWKESRFEHWRRLVADQRMAFHHPWRWRVTLTRRWLHRAVVRQRMRMMTVRERLALRLAPWLEDGGAWY